MTAPSPEVCSFHEFEAMSREAAGRVLEAARRALDSRGRFALVLSGGKTPRRLYELLSAAGLPWRRTHIFWGDERCVPRDDAASNYRLARESLLSRAPIPAENVHAMPCDPADPAAGAAAYEAELHAFFGGAEATFDLVLLGVGDDGHTASLFPGEPTLEEKKRLVLSTPGLHASPPVPRLTLTLPALNSAHEALLLAAGPKKKPFFDRAAEGDMSFPAARVRPSAGAYWLWSQEEP
jgi:6-phosphogluconolactonase